MIENAWLYLLLAVVLFIILLAIFTAITYFILSLFRKPEAKTMARHIKARREKARKDKKG